MTNCRAKTTPIVIGSANYRDPFILTRDRIDPVRSEDMISVSGSYLDATIHCFSREWPGQGSEESTPIATDRYTGLLRCDGGSQARQESP